MVLAIVLAFSWRDTPYRVTLRTSQEPTCVVEGPGNSWTFAPRRLNPWQLRVSDVDGNGKPDFLIGVYKRANVVTTPHRTLFIYEFRGDEVVPQWRASSLGRELLDFNPVKLSSGTRVVTVERTLDGKEALSVYKWRGFGLFKLRELAIGKQIRLAHLPWKDGEFSAVVDQKAIKWTKE